jgi:outer membrane protein OmpA-like peptidoglycan-associated protein
MTPQARFIAALMLILLCCAACSRISPRPPPPAAPPSTTTPAQARQDTDRAALTPEAAPAAIRRRMASLIAAGHASIDPAALGYYLDVQQARLQQIGSQQLQVVREGDALRLRLPASAGFALGRATLMPAGEQLIDQLAIVLREYDASFIAVHGHTDDSGNPEHNRHLSGQRARAVSARLQRAGIAPGRLVAVGHGQTQPLVPNDSESGRERNRRVELELLPILR